MSYRDKRDFRIVARKLLDFGMQGFAGITPRSKVVRHNKCVASFGKLDPLSELLW